MVVVIVGGGGGGDSVGKGLSREALIKLSRLRE